MNVAQMLRNTLFGVDDWEKLDLAMRVVLLEKDNEALKNQVDLHREGMAGWNAEVKEVKDRLKTLEIKFEALEDRTLGWQEGFGEGVRKQLRYMDERIAKLLESDDSGDFEIRQWIEELHMLRKDFSALEKRVEFIEKFKPVVVREQPSVAPQPMWPSYQPIRTVPEVGKPDPLNPPWKITCQTKDEACE